MEYAACHLINEQPFSLTGHVNVTEASQQFTRQEIELNLKQLSWHRLVVDVTVELLNSVFSLAVF